MYTKKINRRKWMRSAGLLTAGLAGAPSLFANTAAEEQPWLGTILVFQSKNAKSKGKVASQ